ncbi:hypothetical protein Tco_0046142 [Tanacetum coccineum]
MDDPNITMEEYIRLEEEKARRHGKVYNWETATYGKIWDNKDVYDLRFVETEFPAIVFNETLTYEATSCSCEPTICSLNNDEIDFRISFDETDNEDCMQKAHILELKRRYFEDYRSEDQYAVSIKEDMAYRCLHSPKTTKGMKINTPYPKDSIRRIQDMESI